MDYVRVSLFKQLCNPNINRLSQTYFFIFVHLIKSMNGSSVLSFFLFPFTFSSYKPYLSLWMKDIYYSFNNWISFLLFPLFSLHFSAIQSSPSHSFHSSFISSSFSHTNSLLSRHIRLHLSLSLDPSLQTLFLLPPSPLLSLLWLPSSLLFSSNSSKISLRSILLSSLHPLSHFSQAHCSFFSLDLLSIQLLGFRYSIIVIHDLASRYFTQRCWYWSPNQSHHHYYSSHSSSGRDRYKHKRKDVNNTHSFANSLLHSHTSPFSINSLTTSVRRN